MRIKDSIHKLTKTWLGLIFLGAVLAVGGCVQTMAFLNDVPTYKTITARQLVRQLVIPHMIMLCGLGLLVGSLIFAARHVVIRSRMRHQEP